MITEVEIINRTAETLNVSYDEAANAFERYVHELSESLRVHGKAHLDSLGWLKERDGNIYFVPGNQSAESRTS